MKYHFYPKYKTTAIQWLPKIPIDWNIKRLKFLTEKILTGSTPPSSIPNLFEGDFNWFTPADFDDSLILEKSERTISQDAIDDGYVKTYPPNTILIVSIGSIGKVGLSKNKSSSNQQINAAIPNKKVNPKFLTYTLFSQEEIMKNISNATILGIMNQFRTKQLLIAVPNILEQKNIAAFLDYKTKQIDELIEKKEKLLKLLEEKRIALITKAVTKGINPDVKLKPSGIDWLGDIPEHWICKDLKYLLKDGFDGLKIGPFGSQIKSDELSNSGYKIYGQENVINKDFTLGYRYLDEEKFNELIVYEIKSGDLLVTMMGTAGSAEIVPKKFDRGIMDSHLIRLRTNKLLDTNYSRYLINDSTHIQYALKYFGKGSIMQGLNSTIIKNLIILLPPIEEQQQILEYLKFEIEKIVKLKKSIKDAIEKLKEYRTALITAAVTGKIRVPSGDLRNWQQNPSLSFARRGTEGEVKKEEDEPLKSASGKLK